MSSGALAALIASLALAVAPASAQDRGRWQERSADHGNNGGDARAQQRSQRANPDGAQARPRGDAVQRSQQVGRPQAQPNRGYNQSGAPWSGQGMQTRRDQPTVQQQQPARRTQYNGTQQYNERRRQQLNDGNRAAQQENWRNRRGATASDPWNVRSDPEWRRQNGDTRRWNDDNRQGWNGNRNTWNTNNRNTRNTWNNDRRGYGQNQSWNRGWRNDNRYDWRGYRSSNRNVYRLGSYYAPSRNYSYRRLNSGFFLDSMFFSDRYWINDPWQYRLPEADGPYRWIRYYDDVLLVDTYSGEVVDVIHDFFW